MHIPIYTHHCTIQASTIAPEAPAVQDSTVKSTAPGSEFLVSNVSDTAGNLAGDVAAGTDGGKELPADPDSFDGDRLILHSVTLLKQVRGP